MTAYWILLILTALFAYLIGSLDTMVIASNFVFRRNLRRLGTGEVWLSNFRRVYGVKGFAMLLATELIKDLIPILIGGLLLGFKGHADVGRAFAGFCMVLGRLFPAGYGFRGSCGACAMIVAAFSAEASVGIASLVIAAGVLWFTRYTSLAAVGGAAVFSGVSFIVVGDDLMTKLALYTAILVLVKNIPALIRILRKTEVRYTSREDITWKLDR